MTRKLSYLAMAALLLLPACNKNNGSEPVNPATGNTYAGLNVVVGNSLRAEADEAGTASEQKVSKIDLIGNSTTGIVKSWNEGQADQPDVFWKATTTPSQELCTVAPFKTPFDGTQMIGLFINNNVTLTGLNVQNAQNYTYGTAAGLVTEIADLTNANNFAMTSKMDSKVISKGITEETVKTGTTEAQNVFTFDIERVIAKGVVAKGSALKAETNDGKGKVKLDDITFAAVNGAVKTYLFANHAGDRTMGADLQYNNYTSAIDGYVEFAAAKDASAVKDNLVRLGNISKDKAQLGGYAAKNVYADEAAAKAADGIYFLENSVASTAMTDGNKAFGFYRFASAKVYATFTPTQLMKWNETDKKMETLTGDAITEGMTFYKGVTDGFLYDSKASAKKSSVAPNQDVVTYTNGRCGYYALWNRQEQPAKTVVNANTRRNNIYLLTITAFQGLGMPWDSSDPDDPNLPKPGDDPNVTPEEPSIETQDSYMRVEAKILPWNLVTRDVILK